jgi:AAA domain
MLFLTQIERHAMRVGTVELEKPGQVSNNNYLFYGYPGTGKTVIASTFPKPLLLIDINDRGSGSASGVEGVYVANVSSLEEYYSVLEWLEANPKKFKTVVTDTISQLQDLILAKWIAEEGETSQRVWGKVGGDVKDALYRTRDLPCITVFLAQLREMKTEGPIVEANPSLNAPNVIPSVSKIVCSWAYLIGVARIRESSKTPGQLLYTLLLGPDLDYLTKFRVKIGRKVPREIVNPTYNMLQKILLDEAPTATQAVTKAPLIQPPVAEEPQAETETEAVTEAEAVKPKQPIELG